MSGCAAEVSVSQRIAEAVFAAYSLHEGSGGAGTIRGEAGGVNTVAVIRHRQTYVPAHLSKDQDIEISAGDVICVSTPGGGYGPVPGRDPATLQTDLERGSYSAGQALRFGAGAG